MAFKDRVIEIRKELGYTQKQMAEYCGISYGTLQHYEKGAESPAAIFFMKIAKLGYNLDWLLTGGSVKMIYDCVPRKTLEYQNQKKEKPGTNKLSLKGIIEEWVQDVREKEGNTDRIVMELAMQVPEFRQWYQEKKNKTTLAEDDLTREKIA